ncbi:hypothetical protein D3C75_779280 [compost metagenome]
MIPIIQSQRNLTIVHRFTRITSGKDNILHLAAAQRLGALFAQHPADAVGNITFAAAVWPDYCRYAAHKFHFRFIGKRFKAS